MVTRTPSSHSSYPPTRLAFHVSRILIDVGVLLVLGAMSLSFVSAEDFGQRAVAADALPALLLILPIFVVTLLPDHSRPIPTALGWLSLLLAATALPYAVVKYFDASTLAGTLGGNVGVGARILVLGAFVTLAGIVLGLVRNLLGLPVAGTYPARPEPTAAETAARGRHPATAATPARSATRAPGPTPPAPPRRRAPAAATHAADPPPPASPAGRAPGAPDPRPRAVPRRPAGPPQTGKGTPPAPPPPRSSDPDTEPTLPGGKRGEWWPDDLEDLLS